MFTYVGDGQEDPNSRYTFDSERDAPQSELCREGKEKGRKCIMVRLSPSVQPFKQHR